MLFVDQLRRARPYNCTLRLTSVLDTFGWPVLALCVSMRPLTRETMQARKKVPGGMLDTLTGFWQLGSDLWVRSRVAITLGYTTTFKKLASFRKIDIFHDRKERQDLGDL